MRATAPTFPMSPLVLPQEPSVVPAGLPAQDQEGRSVVPGGFGGGTLTVIGGFKNV